MSPVATDAGLVRRASAGDERALTAIFRRYHQRLYRYCLALVGNRQDAEDALQNTMVKVMRALPGEQRRIELKPWLYRIAHNESIELLRRRRETGELDAEQAAPGSGLVEEAASRERLRQLLSDLDELPERQRGALVMRELAGLEFAEIGAALGTSPAVARQTLYEARLGLRQMDRGREMDCAAVTRALSDGDGRVGRRRDLRAHLRTCPDCRRFSEEIDARRHELAALAPLPAIAAAGLLQGVLGGGTGAAGGGVVGAGGGVAAKSVATSVLLKGAATVAVVAVVGIGAADRGGLIDLGRSGGESQPARGAAAGGATVPGEGASGAPAATSARKPVRDPRQRALARRRAVRPGPAPRDTAASPIPADGGAPTAGSTTIPAASPAGGSAGQSHGGGHKKQHPGAAAHGEQTAAGHKSANHGSTAAHPVHPAHPSPPSQAKSPAGPPAAPATEPKPDRTVAATPAAPVGESARSPEIVRDSP